MSDSRSGPSGENVPTTRALVGFSGFVGQNLLTQATLCALQWWCTRMQ